MGSGAVPAMVLVLQALPSQSGTVLGEPSRGVQRVRCPHTETQVGGQVCFGFVFRGIKS